MTMNSLTPDSDKDFFDLVGTSFAEDFSSRRQIEELIDAVALPSESIPEGNIIND